MLDRPTVVILLHVKYLLIYEGFIVRCIVEFPTTRTELNAVFDIFDRHRTGEIYYSEFMEALRPERQVGYSFNLTVSASPVWLNVWRLALVRENGGWSRSPRSRSSLLLMLGVLRRIGQHGGRYDPSTVKRREREREREREERERVCVCVCLWAITLSGLN